MTRDATVPGRGLLRRRGVYELTPTEAVFVVNRGYGYVNDGSLLVDLILELAPVAEIANHYDRLHVVQTELAGYAQGKSVHIVGCGPSAADFVRTPDTVVIACNAAINHIDADIALIVEGVSINFDWFEQTLAFPGPKVFDCAVSSQMQGKLARAYPPSLWRSILWVRRRAYIEGEDLSQIGMGLVYDESSGQIRGTVACQAVHLAKIMGAKDVHMHGVELYFPDGRQHFYEGQVYTHGDTVESLIDLPDGRITTTYFAESARSIKLIAAAAGLEMHDHSGGLLSTP